MVHGSWVRRAEDSEGVRDNYRVPGTLACRSWCGPRIFGAGALEKVSWKVQEGDAETVQLQLWLVMMSRQEQGHGGLAEVGRRKSASCCSLHGGAP